MKRIILAAGILATFCCAVADDEPMVKCGGAGRLVVVNASGTPFPALPDMVKKMEELLMINTVITTGKWDMASAEANRKALSADIAVFVVREDALPISLIAMESRWALVNAKTLSEKSVGKELLRVVATLFGSMGSQYEKSALCPAFSADDLEQKVGDVLTIDVLLPILNGLATFGFEQYNLMPRKDAVAEGYLKK